MDGLTTAAILSGFLATWLQIALLYYKIGKLEQKIDLLNNNYARGREEGRRGGRKEGRR